MNADSLVRLGRLRFEDFLLLEASGVRAVLADPDARADLALALANAPDIEIHFRRCSDIGPMCPIGPIPILEARTARTRLVRRFALLLLKHKSPPLYDCLPWHDWDFSIVTRRHRLWQTRFLLAGEGTTTLISRLPRTAGVYVAEPLDVIRRYVAEKARLDGIRRLCVLPGPTTAEPFSPFPISLPDSSADLAVVGSVARPDALLPDVERIAPSVLLVENCPLFPPLPAELLESRGYRYGTLAVTGLGTRPCWYLAERAGR